MISVKYAGSGVSGFVGGDSLLEGSVFLDVGVVADCSSSVSDEALVDTLEGNVSLLFGLFDAVLVVFVVLVLGRVVLVFSHLW